MTAVASIVWFKRDLRINDHAPLLAAVGTNTPLIPLYIVEPAYWRQPFASRRHWHYIHDSLVDLNVALTQLGQPLIIKVGDACNVIETLRERFNVGDIYVHEETGNAWTFGRDIAVEDYCKAQNIALHEFPSNGVVRRLRSRDDWSKIRNTRMAEPIVPKPEVLVPAPNLQSDDLPTKDDALFGNTPIGRVQTGGRLQAVSDLRSFLNHRSSNYLYHISAPERSEHHC